MACLGIVPARAGSKRLPGKNTRPLAGKPLVAWAIECGIASSCLDRLVVSSDDETVLEIAREYDPSIALKRPAELAADNSPAIEYVTHAIEALRSNGEGPFDTIVILQPTSPFTRPLDVLATVSLLETSGADSAVSIVKLDHAVHPIKLKLLVGDKLLPFVEEEEGRMAAKDLPEIYVRNCSVYATRMKTVDSGLIIGKDCRGYLMPRERSIDINDIIDFEFAEFLANRLDR